MQSANQVHKHFKARDSWKLFLSSKARILSIASFLVRLGKHCGIWNRLRQCEKAPITLFICKIYECTYLMYAFSTFHLHWCLSLLLLSLLPHNFLLIFPPQSYSSSSTPSCLIHPLFLRRQLCIHLPAFSCLLTFFLYFQSLFICKICVLPDFERFVLPSSFHYSYFFCMGLSF